MLLPVGHETAAKCAGWSPLQSFCFCGELFWLPNFWGICGWQKFLLLDILWLFRKQLFQTDLQAGRWRCCTALQATTLWCNFSFASVRNKMKSIRLDNKLCHKQQNVSAFCLNKTFSVWHHHCVSIPSKRRIHHQNPPWQRKPENLWFQAQGVIWFRLSPRNNLKWSQACQSS